MPTVLLLGAASDMAVAIAKKFASNGYAIQLAARNAEKLKPLQSDISIRFNTPVTLHEFDALQFNSHEGFYSSLSPAPDVVVCVFGYLGEQQKAEQSWQEAERIIHTNYTGAVSILNVAANYFAAQKKGCIVGISSVAGERGRQSNFIYGSAKAGFTAYLQGLRNRLFHQGVHVVSVQPGFAYTKMTENLKLPKPLTAYPEEIADGVYKAVIKRKNVIYVKWMWRYIMLIIKSVPEPVFKKLKM